MLEGHADSRGLPTLVVGVGVVVALEQGEEVCCGGHSHVLKTAQLLYLHHRPTLTSTTMGAPHKPGHPLLDDEQSPLQVLHLPLQVC